MEITNTAVSVSSALSDAVLHLNVSAASKLPPVTTLCQCLSLKRRDKLLRLAKVLQLKGYASLKKVELAHAIAEKLKAEDILAGILAEADEDEFELFLKALQPGGFNFPADEHSSFHSLQAFGIIGAFCSGDSITLIVPDEIKDVWSSISSDSFIREKRLAALLNRYALVAVNLYGAIKVSTLTSIIDKYESLSVAPDDATRLLLPIIRRSQPFYLWNDYIVNAVFGDDIDSLEELLDISSGKPRFLPKKDELLKFSSPAYIEDTDEAKILLLLLADITGDERLALLLAGDIRMMLASGAALDDCLIMLKSCGIEFNNDDRSLQNTVSILGKFAGTCRLWKHRGNSDAAMSDFTTPERNDQCPCGSGLKYKKCCAGK